MMQMMKDRWVWILIAAIGMGALVFPWWVVAVEIILVASLWGLAGKSKAPALSGRWWWGLALVILLSRLLVFAWSSLPFGYDTGLYRYEMWQSFQALPEYVSGLFLGLPLLSSVFQLFGASIDGLLLGMPVLFSVLVGGLLVIFVKERFGSRPALIAGLLFALSLVQWQAFEMILLKQLLALGLVMLSFLLLEKRSWWVAPVLGFLVLLQPLDALFVGGAVVIMAAIDRGYWLKLLGLGVLGMGLLFLIESGFWQDALEIFQTGLLSPGDLEVSLQEGVFLGLKQYGYQASLYFALGVGGLIWTTKKEGWGLFQGYVLLVALWVFAGLFFSQRLLIQLDLALMIFAALFLEALMGKERWVVMVILGAAALPMVGHLWRFQPLISAEELANIETFCEELPEEAFIMATDSAYAPWMRGYCLDQRVIAPGMFEWNQWSKEQWVTFWRGDRQEELLSIYEGDLWLYIGKNQPEVLLSENTFEDLGEGWWKRR